MSGKTIVAAGLLCCTVACSEPEPSGGALLGDACEGEDTVVCASSTPSNEATFVAACRDAVLETLVICPDPETCIDAGIPGAAACSDQLTFVPYAIAGAVCPSEDAQACDTDRASLLRCEAGQWSSDNDCSDEIQRCEVPEGADAPVCADPDRRFAARSR